MSAPVSSLLGAFSKKPIEAISRVGRKLPEVVADPLKSLARADRAFNQPSLSSASKGINLLTAA
jgi:hypothetical protein